MAVETIKLTQDHRPWADSVHSSVLLAVTSRPDSGQRARLSAFWRDKMSRSHLLISQPFLPELKFPLKERLPLETTVWTPRGSGVLQATCMKQTHGHGPPKLWEGSSATSNIPGHQPCGPAHLRPEAWDVRGGRTHISSCSLEHLAILSTHGHTPHLLGAPHSAPKVQPLNRASLQGTPRPAPWPPQP